jgi:hypothetical protein
MMNKPNNPPARVTGQDRLPPVRVKVFGADGKIARVHPPDGESKNWWLI